MRFDRSVRGGPRSHARERARGRRSRLKRTWNDPAAATDGAAPASGVTAFRLFLVNITLPDDVDTHIMINQIPHAIVL